MSEKPDLKFSRFDSHAEVKWLGKAVALVNKWSPHEANMLQGDINAINPLFGGLTTGNREIGIFTRIYKVISDLELRTGTKVGEVFPAGAVYDVFRALRDQILSAEREILIVDPYLDADSFHKYCHEVAESVAVHLLVGRKRDGKPTLYFAALQGAVSAFNRSYSASVEIRQTGELHDRILVLDSDKVWVIGQSIKDAAKDSPTYFIALDATMAALKRDYYEKMWATAESV